MMNVSLVLTSRINLPALVDCITFSQVIHKIALQPRRRMHGGESSEVIFNLYEISHVGQ